MDQLGYVSFTLTAMSGVDQFTASNHKTGHPYPVPPREGEGVITLLILEVKIGSSPKRP